MNATGHRPPVAVTVIGGYLGAGKTTLLNHLLRAATERIVVLVNDFGTVNIDEQLIVARSEDMIALANGCICCSLVDGLSAALDQVRRLDPPPDRLVIEASGVADPASIAAYGHDNGLQLDGVITIIDAETVRTLVRDRYVGDIVRRQLAAADLLVLNKADLITADELAAVRAWLAEIADGRPILEAVHAAVPLVALLGHHPGVSVSGPSSPVANEVFASFTLRVDAAFDPVALADSLATWPLAVVRVKGVVRVAGATGDDDRTAIVQRVGRRLSITDGGPWSGDVSLLVAIGVANSFDPGALERDVRKAISTTDRPAGS